MSQRFADVMDRTAHILRRADRLHRSFEADGRSRGGGRPEPAGAPGAPQLREGETFAAWSFLNRDEHRE